MWTKNDKKKAVEKFYKRLDKSSYEETSLPIGKPEETSMPAYAGFFELYFRVSDMIIDMAYEEDKGRRLMALEKVVELMEALKEQVSISADEAQERVSKY